MLNAFLIFLLGLSHGYAVITAGLLGTYFLFSRRSFFSNLKYLLAVYGLGFLLLGFWLMPFFEHPALCDRIRDRLVYQIDL